MNQTKQRFLGYSLIICNVVCWQISSTSAQVLERAVPDFELGAFRYAGTMLLCLFWVAIQRPNLHIPIALYGFVITMSVTSSLFNMCFFAAVSILPLSHANGGYRFLKMVFMALVVSYASHLPCNKLLILSMFGCCTGLIFTVQPWSGFDKGFTPGFFIPEANASENSLDYDNFGHITLKSQLPIVILGYTLVILSALMGTVRALMVGVYLKPLKPIAIVFANAAICLPLQILMSFYLEDPVISLGIWDILIVALHSASSALGLIAAVTGLQLINTLQVQIIQSLGVVMALIPQYTLSHYYLYGRRNVLEVLGCVIVTAFVGISAFPTKHNFHEDFK